MISLSDWVLIGCTVTLAIIALFGPYINELLKREKFAPKLKITFQKEYPYVGGSGTGTVISTITNYYDFCFGVKNEGNSKAKNCEVIMEEFYFKNKKGDLIENNRDFPAALPWTVGPSHYFAPIDIFPKANKFFHIFYIGTSALPKYQDKLLFFMNMEKIVPSSRVNRILVPLNYVKIKIVIYSENAKKCEQYIEIKSPGIKRKKREQNLKEMQVIFF